MQPFQHDDDAIFGFIAKATNNPDIYRTILAAIPPDSDNETFDILHLNDGRIFERKSRPARHGELILGRVFSLTDVTELKKAESELRIAATAFESQEAMIIFDANQVILKVNQAFTRITGYSGGEAVGMTPTILKLGVFKQTALRSEALLMGQRKGLSLQTWGASQAWPQHLTISVTRGDLRHGYGTKRQETKKPIFRLA